MRRTRMVEILFAASILAGCSTTGPFGREKLALPIGPSYVGGRGMQMFPASMSLISNVKDSMSDVGVYTIVQNEDPSGVTILEGKSADDRKVRVTIQTSGNNSTVSAKIGWLGDEQLTRALLDRIGSRQGTMPPPPIPADEEVSGEPKRTQPLFSKDAVPDATMLQDQLGTGTRPSPF